MSKLNFAVTFCLMGRDNVVIENEFESGAACAEWAEAYGAKLPGYMGYSAKVVGVDGATVRRMTAAAWAAMGMRARRALVQRAQYTAGEVACVLDDSAAGFIAGQERLAWLVLFRPLNGWEWEA